MRSFRVSDNPILVKGPDLTSRGLLISGTEPADDCGKPAPRPLDQVRPHLVMSRSAGRPVVRCPQQLRLHRALDELGISGVIHDLNDASLLRDEPMPEPILITMSGTILAGFGRWRSAFFDGRPEIHCIEYPLSDDQALQFILNHHQPQRGWSAFIRIRLALTLEPHFQQRALENMRAGGKYKGSANLPE